MVETAGTAGTARRLSGSMLGTAVHRHKPLSAEGLTERAFTLAFSSFVYPQIWEDPCVDMEALALEPTSRMVTIASGGCNVMSYLTAGPAQITAVDLVHAHVALNRLKLAAARHVPDYAAFRRFFADADRAENVATFDTYVAPHLDAETAAYWTGRDMLGRRRITRFGRGFYRYGLLGMFIAAGHVAARLNGADPRAILTARSQDEQRAIFERELSPLFDRPVVRWLVNRQASLFGLGIPPEQYRALAGSHAGGIAEVLRERLGRLACGFPLSENYFVWQAFGKGYGRDDAAPLPPYLERKNFDLVRERADRVDVRHVSMTDFLADQPAASLDRYVLLDAQDWMSNADLARLWTEITRTAGPGARVIFRTAAEETPLPGRVPHAILGQWHYAREPSRAWTRRDRSAIYGGFHLYVREA